MANEKWNNLKTSLKTKTINEIEEKFKEANYGTFKKEIAEVVIAKIEKIQSRYNELINSEELDKILDDGAKRSKEIAKAKYELVKKKMGLGR